MTPEFDTPCTPGDEEWHRRLELFMTDDSPIGWHWLSFLDTDMPYTEEGDYPGGPRHKGVCIVPAPNIVFAAQVAWELGCNPGGEVRSFPAAPPGWHPKHEYVGRLFAGEEALALGALELEELCEPD